MKEENINQYAEERKKFVVELISNSRIQAQKVSLKRCGINEWTRKGANLFVTQEDYNKLVNLGKVI